MAKANSWRILLIDDDQEEYLLTRAMLSESRLVKFSVVWVDNYQDGLQALTEDVFDAALIDYQLMDRKGIHLISEAMALGCKTPMLLLTGQGSYEVDMQAMQAGAADYLNKQEINPILLERSIRYAIERKQVENKLVEANAALRESEGRFRIGLENAQVTVFTQDLDLRFTWIYNPLDGLTADRSIGKRDDENSRGGDVTELIAIKQAVLDSGVGVEKEIHLAGSGGTIDYLISLEPLRDETGLIVGLRGAGVDVTHHRRLEAQRTEHATRMEVHNRLLDQREQERQQIARNLHDGPVQDLISIIFSMQSAINQAPTGEMREMLEALRERAKLLTNDLRSVCNELRPPSLMKFGLEHAIRSHATEFAQNYIRPNIQLELACQCPELPESVRIALFRIYQESMFNAMRHSQASNVFVTLTAHDEAVHLEIRDDGMGFLQPDDWMDLAKKGHLGLLGMRERAAAVGGHFDIYSTSGQGTVIQVKVPVSGL